jgi:hypothetical protein
MAKKARQANQRARRDECPITRAAFGEHASALSTKIGDVLMSVEPRFFNPGSFGWYGNGESELTVDGVELPVKLAVTVTVKHSKNAQ